MKKLYALLFAIFVTACKSDSDPEPQVTLDSEFYQNYYNVNISPALTNFKTEIETEVTYIQNFITTPSSDNYTLLTDQWLICAKAYAKARVYDFGEIEDGFFDKNIYNFPINTTIVEYNIDEETSFDSDYFSTKSTVTKGLGAMEYLIYANNNTDNAKALLLENPYRLDYLLGLAQEILRQTDLMITTWENGYYSTFINANASSCTSNATCLSVNQLINIIDVTKVTKIGKTAGFESSSSTAEENLEAFRSRSSLLLIEAMLDEVKKAFQEGDSNFAMVVDQIDSSGLISKSIETKFSEISSVIAALDNNLYDAILTDTSTIEPIYYALSDLTILFSVDVASALSITVLPTDNDSD